jgi:hypothetical protein
VLTSHDPERAAKCADHVVTLTGGAASPRREGARHRVA